MKNIIIGYGSGSDITDQSGYFILGDNISVADVDNRTATDTIFFDSNKKIAIKKDMLSAKALAILGFNVGIGMDSSSATTTGGEGWNYNEHKAN